MNLGIDLRGTPRACEKHMTYLLSSKKSQLKGVTGGILRHRRVEATEGRQGQNGAASGDIQEAHTLEKGTTAQRRNASYLFACHLAWRDRRDVEAYQKLVAALDDCNREIRAVAEMLLHRSSPRPPLKIVGGNTEQQ